jgi:serine/threonine protein kinase/Tol biopolymer transport system component
LALNSGSRLGPYEIVEPIGAGGMGEVYRALDTRLERTVAVKVLPAHLSDSAEARQRFEREARAISRLSHPHICALYDVGREGEIEYLVMEYLEGETLSARLAKESLPLEQTLRLAGEIARALDAAHRQGIVHRDLKPQNVMLTRSGVKLLDFGLARKMAPAVKETDVTALAPVAEPITREGTIVGTFQYMAPEQLEGQDADARTDIFAFGAVLYEMATGERAFKGSSQVSLITAIRRDEPAPISQVQPMTPPALERLVRTCLAKNPDERWQSAHDLASELEWIRESSTSGARSRSGEPALPPRRAGRAAVPWTIALLAVAAAIAMAIFARRPAPSPTPLRASLLAPEGAAFDLLGGPAALSPDGSKIAFAGRNAQGRTSLYMRPLDSEVARVFQETESVSFPFWSADGRYIGYSTGNTVAFVPAGGGVPEKIVDLIRASKATWSPSGEILASRGNRTPIVRFSLADRKPRPVIPLAADEIAQASPQFLPDGKHFIYLSRRLDQASRTVSNEIRVGSLGSAESISLGRAESSAVYADPGYLLFLRGSELVARPFDASKMSFSGEPFAIARSVASTEDKTMPLFSASNTGTVAWAQGDSVGLSQLAVYDLAGKQESTLGPVGDVWTPRLSHDGRRAAVEVMDRVSTSRDIWIYDFARPSLPVRMTFDPGDMATPVWSPDDARVAYLYRRIPGPEGKPPEWSIRIQSARGEGREDVVYTDTRTSYLTDWSPDGSFLAFNRPDPKMHNDEGIFSIPDRRMRIAIQTPAEDRDGTFSPDGRWIAYMSSESGRFEIYVQAFPGPGGKWQISTGGGNQPRWRRDGKALFYVTLDGQLMTVPVRTSPAFEADEPRALFAPRMRRTLIAQYDVFPEGNRLLVNWLPAPDASKSIEILQNWKR